MQSTPLARLKSRYLVVTWFVVFLLAPGLDLLYGVLSFDTPLYWFDVLTSYYFQLSLFVMVVLVVFLFRVNLRPLYNPVPINSIKPSIKLTIYIFFFSLAALYALFYPLSFVAEDFVQFWLIDLPPIIYSDEASYPFLPNLLGFISLVILAPLLEELIFRGLLLHRWTYKYGLKKAILLSSLLFGIAHPDPIGATAFGIGMCIIYINSQTLWVPILCHAFNNLVVWLLEAANFAVYGPEFEYTLQDFYDEWYLAVISTVIVVFWTRHYLRSKKSRVSWHLPEVG